ncbi:MAG: hypothetical protein ACLR6B_16555 [Blautia sp.]
MVYIQFGAVEDFLELMVAAQAIPHTDLERYPSVRKKLKRESRKRLKKETLRKNSNRKQQAGESACKKEKETPMFDNNLWTMEPVGREENTVQGKTYRFTLLTPCLIRMEYREDGQFEDRPTQSVWNRRFEAVPHRLVKDGEGFELLQTVCMWYIPESRFPKTA